MKAILLGVILTTLALTGGCFETELNLGSPQQARVESAYCGEWNFNDSAGSSNPTESIIILKFDDHQYYVELNDADGKSPERMAGFIQKIKSADFAQLTALGDNHDAEKSHLILRVGLKDGKLSLRQLDKSFFEGITTDAALHQKLEDNIDNPRMYEAEEQLATRKESK